MPWSSDAVVMLNAGIPSIVLTDFSALHPYDAMHSADDVFERIDAERLGRWVLATAAVVRRLDALEGRPRWEEEYLAFGGRVWIRRDLLWIGLALWIALVLRRSRGAGPAPGATSVWRAGGPTCPAIYSGSRSCWRPSPHRRWRRRWSILSRRSG